MTLELKLMDEYRRGRNAGREEGRKEERESGVKAMIEMAKEMNSSREFVLSQLMSKYSLTKDSAEDYLEKYW